MNERERKKVKMEEVKGNEIKDERKKNVKRVKRKKRNEE